jgi:hypothetical protein
VKKPTNSNTDIKTKLLNERLGRIGLSYGLAAFREIHWVVKLLIPFGWWMLMKTLFPNFVFKLSARNRIRLLLAIKEEFTNK